MNYLEEQLNEIEALESIYFSELEILTREPQFKFTIEIKSEEYQQDSEEGLSCNLKFTYTETYPDEIPEIEIVDPENLEENDASELLDFVISQANENIGMAMIFTLVSASQEWLNCKWDKLKQEKQDEHERKVREAEAEEMKRFEGTKVTVESFLAWKLSFEEEIGLTSKKLKEEKEGKKLTGKELFMCDKTLIESDLKFLEDAGETVKVDESLFQDLDDLELNEAELSDS